MVLTVRNGHRGAAVATLHLCPASPRERVCLGLAGVTTRPAGYYSGGIPPAVERLLHLLTTHEFGVPGEREGTELWPRLLCRVNLAPCFETVRARASQERTYWLPPTCCSSSTLPCVGPPSATGGGRTPFSAGGPACPSSAWDGTEPVPPHSVRAPPSTPPASALGSWMPCARITYQRRSDSS